MIGETITCHNDGCEEKFAKRTHNQIYHDEECTRLATNANIMRKYYARRAQRLGLARFCACGTKLSRYNPEDKCNACTLTQSVQRNNSVQTMLTTVIA